MDYRLRADLRRPSARPWPTVESCQSRVLRLFSNPAGPGWGVFEDDAAGDKIVANGVGSDEVTAGSRRLALAN